MKLAFDPNLPVLGALGYEENLNRRLNDLHRNIGQQVNALTEGRISAIYNASTAAPTAGSYVQGDFIRNSAPAEAGTAGSKYVKFGWVCVSSGTPGTWVECRFLTGN